MPTQKVRRMSDPLIHKTSPERPLSAPTQKKKSVTFNIPKNTRPHTAGANRHRHKFRRSARPGIRELVAGKGGALLPDSDRVVRRLRYEIEKTLYSKRNKLDTLKFILSKKKTTVGVLRTKLKELMVDGDALGLHKDNRDRCKRLVPNSAVSMRPIYFEETDLGQLATRVEKKRLEKATAIFRRRQYEHMLDVSLARTKQSLERTNEKLGEEVNAQKALCSASEANLLRTKEEIAAVGKAIESVRQKMNEEREMWIEELEKRKRAFEQKRKVTEFYGQMMEKQKMVELSDGTDLNEAEEMRLLEARARLVVDEEDKESTEKKAKQAKAHEEEEMLQKFFSECGIDVREQNNHVVYSTIEEQTRNEATLTEQRDNLLGEVQSLKSKIKSMTNDLEERTFASRSKHPALTKLESTLSELEKEHEGLREERASLRNITSSIQIALGVMGERYVGPHFEKDFSGDDVLLCGVLVKRVGQIALATAPKNANPYHDHQHNLALYHSRRNHVPSTAAPPRGLARSQLRSSSSSSTISSSSSSKKRSSKLDDVAESITMNRREFLASHLLSQAMLKSATSLECSLTPHNIRVRNRDERRAAEKGKGIREFLLHDVYSGLKTTRDKQKRKTHIAKRDKRNSRRVPSTRRQRSSGGRSDASKRKMVMKIYKTSRGGASGAPSRSTTSTF
eukprot:g1226.t1